MVYGGRRGFFFFYKLKANLDKTACNQHVFYVKGKSKDSGKNTDSNKTDKSIR